VNIEYYKRHYYGSHKTINPYLIVPIGPEIDFAKPHDAHAVVTPPPNLRLSTAFAVPSTLRRGWGHSRFHGFTTTITKGERNGHQRSAVFDKMIMPKVVTFLYWIGLSAA